MTDEELSTEDIKRFGDDGDHTGWCPDCGWQVYDEAEFCQECGNQIGGRVLRRPPAAAEFHKRMMLLVTVVVIVVFFFVFVM
ncbi:MAG: zinc ribbon domain-containing protein [Phycisphaerales bacterium]|jgi:uncharacterized membrane protein YvbJ|nr:zinc ribbon domain-containing protein [Phycisphaerales bacterium]MDP6890247.1 zinc ribbon domain-containing protein [Phycisphaerales bacterium]